MAAASLAMFALASWSRLAGDGASSPPCVFGAVGKGKVPVTLVHVERGDRMMLRRPRGCWLGLRDISSISMGLIK